MIDQQCEADQEKFNKLRLRLVCIVFFCNLLVTTLTLTLESFLHLLCTLSELITKTF